MTLDEVQKAVDDWIRGTPEGYWNAFEILAHLTEELGELSAALQREKGLRPPRDGDGLAGEVGDLLYTLAAFANAKKIRLEDALEGTLAKYGQRDRRE